MFGWWKKKDNACPKKDHTIDNWSTNRALGIVDQMDKLKRQRELRDRLEAYRRSASTGYSNSSAGQWTHTSRPKDPSSDHIVVSKKRARRLAEYEDILDEIARDPMIAEAWQKFQTFRKMRKE